ncbi:MAG: penicillin-binding protein 2 [Lachnospiraceae bacterium]|nr:penicillin-binding protein 2 [Lachnospiraceae bacterium]
MKKTGSKDNKKTKQVPQPLKVRKLEIILVSLFFTVLTFALIGNLVVYMKRDSQEAINNDYNPRQELLANQNIRGKILSSSGDVLARTRVEENGEEVREYPYENLFAHVVGYSTRGKTGIEDSENMNMIFSHDSLGNKIQNELSETKNFGDNIVTTLDVDLQKISYEALGVYSGAVIVSEPSTGKILAMVSKPDYDPNKIPEMWEDLLHDDESSILLNRATQGLYPPGSTFKIVTALEYYREHAGDVSGYKFSCNGKYTQDGNTIKCFHGTKHGAVNFKKSFAKSCNSSFANMGKDLDISSWQKTCDGLLFGRELKTQIPYKKSQMPLSEQDNLEEKLQTAIGQGHTLVTPLEMNMITCAIANQGKCMTPYVVDRIENAKGDVVKRYQPKEEAVMMTPEEASFLNEMMQSVVTEGTATKLLNDSYTAAGKTGSAEFSSSKDDSHAWFTGFAPAEDPKVCVTIIVESAGSGGEYAVPIAKRILDTCYLRSQMSNFEDNK